MPARDVRSRFAELDGLLDQLGAGIAWGCTAEVPAGESARLLAAAVSYGILLRVRTELAADLEGASRPDHSVTPVTQRVRGGQPEGLPPVATEGPLEAGWLVRAYELAGGRPVREDLRRVPSSFRRELCRISATWLPKVGQHRIERAITDARDRLTTSPGGWSDAILGALLEAEQEMESEGSRPSPSERSQQPPGSRTPAERAGTRPGVSAPPATSPTQEAEAGGSTRGGCGPVEQHLRPSLGSPPPPVQGGTWPRSTPVPPSGGPAPESSSSPSSSGLGLSTDAFAEGGTSSAAPEAGSPPAGSGVVDSGSAR